LKDAGDRALFIGDVFHHLLQVYYPHWNFPKKLRCRTGAAEPPHGA